MFEQTNIRNYIILFAIVAIATYFGNDLKSFYDDQSKTEEYELIRTFLLNDAHDSTAFQRNNKPKLWIHTKYELNARQWKSFYSRATTDLNQPYIHLTIKSIIRHCGDSFNICLIDDESFSKLIPSWNITMSSVAEPFRHRMREYGMSILLFMYGGMTVPNTFICFQDLIGLYQEGMGSQGKPFVCERINRYEHIKHGDRRLTFIPDPYFMGCKKGDTTMSEYMEYLRERNQKPHFQAQGDFLGDSVHWFLRAIDAGKMNMVMGEKVGVKTTERRPVMVEELMEESPLKLDPYCYGVYIPEEDILSRNKYQWFAALSSEELLNSRLIVAKYLIQSGSYLSEHHEGGHVSVESQMKYTLVSEGSI